MSKGHSHSPKIEKAPDPEQATIEQNKGLSQMKQRNGLLSTMLGAKMSEGSNANINAYNFTGKEGVNALDEFTKNNTVNSIYNDLKSEGFASEIRSGFIRKITRKVEANKRYREGIESASSVQKQEGDLTSYNTGKKKNNKTSTSSILGTGEADAK